MRGGGAAGRDGGGRLPLSVVIVARDEERDLGRALESVPFAGEVVVVVDAATTDRTREVARSFDRPGRPVRVLERTWAGHVAQKGLALEEARLGWVLCLDADEEVSPALRAEIETLFSAEPPLDGYSVPRRTAYLGRWMSAYWPDRKVRLVRRGRARWGGADPHDRLEVEGRVGRLRGELLHRSYRDVSEHLRKLDLYTRLAARGLEASPVRFPLVRLLLRPPARWLRMMFLKRGFRDGIPGAIAAGMGALYVFLKYARLWEARRDAAGRPAAARARALAEAAPAPTGSMKGPASPVLYPGAATPAEARPRAAGREPAREPVGGAPGAPPGAAR